MQSQRQERNVFHPRELKILKSALGQASERLEDTYGLSGYKLKTAQLIAATAIFEAARKGTLESEELTEAGAESVRVFLTWACAS